MVLFPTITNWVKSPDIKAQHDPIDSKVVLLANYLPTSRFQFLMAQSITTKDVLRSDTILYNGSLIVLYSQLYFPFWLTATDTQPQKFIMRTKQDFLLNWCNFNVSMDK